MRKLLLIAVLCAGCGDTTIFDPMERQPKFKAFAANPQYEDGRAMRPPPEGTVPRERQTMRPEITTASWSSDRKRRTRYFGRISTYSLRVSTSDLPAFSASQRRSVSIDHTLPTPACFSITL